MTRWSRPMFVPHFIRLLAASTLLITVCAQIRIISPKDLARNFAANHGVVYGTTATFGTPYYGQRVLGELVYARSKHGLAHCRSEDYDLPDSKPNQTNQVFMGNRDLFRVVLVDRGQCTFVTKAKVAQLKGAHAVIVVDHKNKSSEEIQRIVMADDGYGSDVRIPSVMVSKPDGLKLIRATTKHHVIVELAWDIPRGEVVVADFWMSSASEEASNFLGRFRDSAETLRSRLQFVPHYHVFSLPAIKSLSGYSSLCIDDKQRYCAPDPDGPGPITGADVAHEDLRQLCLYHTTARRVPTQGRQHYDVALYSEEFWDYVAQLPKFCPLSGDHPDRRFGDICNNGQIKKLGPLVLMSVLDCMQKKRDAYLHSEVVNIAWSPQALMLNGWRYSGPLDPETILKAICHGFPAMPNECNQLLNGFGPLRLLPDFVTVRAFVWSLLLLFSVPLATCFVYKQILKRSMTAAVRQEVVREVQSQMAEYAPLRDTSSTSVR